jgi:hypothetical protein
VERTFDTARRRIMIRAVMTAVVIFLVMGGITALMWQGAWAWPMARSPAARLPHSC